MKKILLGVLLLMFPLLGINAQQKIIIKTQDGTLEYNSWEIESVSFQALQRPQAPTTGEAVDLGLPSGTLWSSVNIGAAKPEEQGFLFGWGETTGLVTSSNLKYFPCETPKGDIAETEFDVAKSYWGGDWRMPTTEDINELINLCSFKYEPNLHAYVVTGPNENTITLPEDTTGTAKYWTGSLSKASSDKAAALSLENAQGETTQTIKAEIVDLIRSNFIMVRPVYGKIYKPIKLSSAYKDVTYSSAVVTTEAVAGDVSEIASYGIFYGDDMDVVTEHKSFNKAYTEDAKSGNYEYNLEDLKHNTSYYAISFVVTEVGDSIFAPMVSFKTLAEFPVAEAIDLGLSVKWASHNMGASAENEIGGHYAWGDPTGKAPYGTAAPNMADIGGTKYDMATQQWGKGWRLPTRAEVEELLALEWSYKAFDNGVTGNYIISKDGESRIYIPAGNVYTQDVNGNITPSGQQFAYIWTSEQLDQYDAYDFVLKSVAGSYATPDRKKYLMSIRPVYDPVEGGDIPSVPEKELTDLGKTFKAIDLGLPSGTKWASRNLGQQADEPSAKDFGEYYAWGETKSKKSFSRGSYTFTEGGRYDGSVKQLAGTDHDAASVQLGGKWHTPSTIELDELINNCTWEFTGIMDKNNPEVYTIRGFKVTGPNGNSIFLPAGGEIVDNNTISFNSTCYYWTSTRTAWLEKGYVLSANFDEQQVYNLDRCIGLLVRPVLSK